MAPVADKMVLAFSFPRVSMRRKAIVNLKMLSLMIPKDCVRFKKAREYLPDEEKEGIFTKRFSKNCMSVLLSDSKFIVPIQRKLIKSN